MRWLPATLVGRTVLVLLVGLALSQMLAFAIYVVDRREAVLTAGGQALAERTAAAVEALDTAPVAARRQLAASFQGAGIRMAWSLQPMVRGNDGDWHAQMVRDSILDYLGGGGADRVRVEIGGGDTTAANALGDDGRPLGFAEVMRRHMGGGMGGGMGWGGMGWWRGSGDGHLAHLAEAWRSGQLLRASVRLADGSWLNVTAPSMAPRPFWTFGFFFSIVAMTLVVVAVSAWAVRRAINPLASFATAAERLGKDVNAPPMAEGGPLEVQKAAEAFNRMQERLRRFIQDRNLLLAAVSHDLRTPITRLRLRAEFVENEEHRRKILADLAEMEAMVASTLAFLRDEAASEARLSFDLAALLQSIIDNATDGGQTARYDGPDHCPCEGRPLALKRAFANLVSNAIQYGGNARVGLNADRERVVVTIDDDGPGLAPAEREKVFTPFYRVEQSRSRETGGVGLGLAVVRSVIRGHGGDVVLDNRPEGGLRATVTLPRR